MRMCDKQCGTVGSLISLIYWKGFASLQRCILHLKRDPGTAKMMPLSTHSSATRLHDETLLVFVSISNFLTVTLPMHWVLYVIGCCKQSLWRFQARTVGLSYSTTWLQHVKSMLLYAELICLAGCSRWPGQFTLRPHAVLQKQLPFKCVSKHTKLVWAGVHLEKAPAKPDNPES